MRSLLVAGLVASLLVRTAHAGDGERWDPNTILVQVGGGVGGGVVGGAVLGVTGLLVGSAIAKRGDWGPPLAGGVIGVVLGAFTGIVVGTQLGGDARDGTGRWWGTTGGAVVGTGAAVALGIATESSRGNEIPKAVAFVLIVVGGSIAGYHLSGEDHAPIAVPLTLRF